MHSLFLKRRGLLYNIKHRLLLTQIHHLKNDYIIIFVENLQPILIHHKQNLSTLV